ncbi:zinc dependent phospholipase C family protein [Bacillus sp. NPDC077411]|uniref:Phospholipase C n=1 Tax=Bacillus bruguierae TaxID=3127667 RepID=A0ABU8FFV2_9BACI
MKKIISTLCIAGTTLSILGAFPQHSYAHLDQIDLNENDPIAEKWSAEAPYHSDKSTHLWIAKQAIEIMKTESNVETNKQAVDFLNFPQYKDLFSKGLYDADYNSEFNDGGLGIGGVFKGGWKSHFYDPDTQKNYRGETDPTALTQGKKYFYESGEHFRNKDYEKAFYYLGVATHYLTDATQPMHAANFTAIDTRAIKYHSAFENYVTTIQNQFAVNTGGNYNDSFTKPEEWIDYVAKVAKPEIQNITNDNTLKYYNSGKEQLWQEMVIPAVQRSLTAAQRNTAGFLNLWFKTFAKNEQAPSIEKALIYDAEGNVVEAGKNYYIVPSESPYQGLTFKWYAGTRYDYVLLANGNNNTQSGTPIEFEFYKENDAKLHHGESVYLHMKNSNYNEYQYLNWSKYSSWVHLAQKSDSLADFKIQINPNNPTEYNIFTDGYPLNYENVNAEKSWIVLGEKTQKPSSWKFVPCR